MNKFNFLVFVITFASKVQIGCFRQVKQDQTELYFGSDPPLHIGLLQHQKDIELFMNGLNNGPLAEKQNNQKRLLSYMYQNDPSSLEANLHINKRYELDDVGKMDYDEIWDKNARKMLSKMTKARGKWVPIRKKDKKSKDVHFPDDHYRGDDDYNDKNYYQNANGHYTSNQDSFKARDYHHDRNKKDFSSYIPKSRYHEDNDAFTNMRYLQQNYESDRSKYVNYPSSHKYEDQYKYPDYSRHNEESNDLKYNNDPMPNGEYRFDGYPQQQDEGEDYKYPQNNEYDEQSKFMDDNEQSKFMNDNEDLKNIDQSKLSNRTQDKEFPNQSKNDNFYPPQGEDHTNQPKTINEHNQDKESDYLHFAQDKGFSYHPDNHQVKDHSYSKNTYQPKDLYDYKQDDQEFAQFEKYGLKDMNYPYNPNEDDSQDPKDADYGYNPKEIDYSYSTQDADYGDDKESYEPNHEDSKYSKHPQQNDEPYKSRNANAVNPKEAKYSNQPEYVEKENYSKEIGHDQEQDIPPNYPQKYSFFKSNPEESANLSLKAANLGSFLYDETLEEVEVVPITQRK